MRKSTLRLDSSDHGTQFAHRKVLGKILDDVRSIHAAFAIGMPESTLAVAVVAIENHVVVVQRRGAHRNVIEIELMTDLPDALKPSSRWSSAPDYKGEAYGATVESGPRKVGCQKQS